MSFVPDRPSGVHARPARVPRATPRIVAPVGVAAELIPLDVRSVASAPTVLAGVQNLSLGGCALTVPDAVFGGQRVLVRLSLAGRAHAIPARVAWCRPAADAWSIGLAFEEVPAGARPALEETLERYRRASTADRPEDRVTAPPTCLLYPPVEVPAVQASEDLVTFRPPSRRTGT